MINDIIYLVSFMRTNRDIEALIKGGVVIGILGSMEIDILLALINYDWQEI